MKKLIIILILFTSNLFAQSETDCPFQAKKYVHYDGIIESASSFVPTNYASIIQNNNNYQRPIDYLGSSAKASCFYKTSIHNHDSILKPFVFVEGISFEKQRANTNLYNMAEYFRQDYYPEPPSFEPECLESYNSSPQHHTDLVGYSTFNWATLVTGIDAEGYYDGDPLKVEKAPELLNQLCCAGYDICFVDFLSGEEYIESNGEALYSILVKLHQQLVNNNSTEKMVVCGASMGGLVSRYAINKLEAEGHTDWVEKFISFDSPQMGANIPLGVQYTLKHMKGLNSALEEKYNKLTCPSASQLVNYSCLETNLGSPITYTTPSPSLERNELMNNPYMGWPQHCTKISISNGSRIGATQSITHTPGDKVLDVDGLLDLDIFALPQNDNNYKKVFDFDPSLCFSALINPLFPFITQQSVRVQNTMALDLAPGSFRTDLNAIANELPAAITGTFGQISSICSLDWVDNSSNTNKLCFIPVMSSIGALNYETILKNQNIVSQTFLSQAFNGQSKFEDFNHQYSHFDIVYAPFSNQSHVEITDENIAWVLEALTGMPDDLWHENYYLTSNTYKAKNEIRAGNNIFDNPICAQTISSVGLGINGNSSYFADLAEQAMHCGDLIIAGNNDVYYKAGNNISLEPGFYTEDNARFQAEIINIPVCYSNGRNAPSNAQNQANNASNNSAINSLLNSAKVNAALKNENDHINQSVQLFPNPANNYVDINSSENITTITLSAVLGSVINSQNINAHQYRLSTSELSNGVYVLTIKTAQQLVKKKIIVRHE